MKITITIQVFETEKNYDISVDMNQRIITTLQVMHENMDDFPATEQIKDIRYGEQMRRVLMESTYEQAKIFSGDILWLITKEHSSDHINSMQDSECKSPADYRAVCEETYKKSDFRARDVYDFTNLLQDNQGLLTCAYTEDEENITFVYDIYEKSLLKNIRRESTESKYRFLINLPVFFEALDKYDILLEDENIYYDRNFFPYGKKRDVKTEDIFDKVKIYKAFIGAVLGEKYGISDYFYGGTETIEGEKWFAPYKDLKTVYAIREALVNSLNMYNEKQKKTRKEVSRIANVIKTVLVVIMGILSVMMTSLYVYYRCSIYPMHVSTLNGEKAFLRKEYVTCIDALRSLKVEKMDYETKYILAVSYAKTENLNSEEITNIVDRLSLTSGERELEYWIYLGREDFSQAEDAAKFLMDDRLLVYVYMKEYNYLESNTQITGEEKEQRMNEVRSQIETLGKKYTPEE